MPVFTKEWSLPDRYGWPLRIIFYKGYVLPTGLQPPRPSVPAAGCRGVEFGIYASSLFPSRIPFPIGWFGLLRRCVTFVATLESCTSAPAGRHLGVSQKISVTRPEKSLQI